MPLFDEQAARFAARRDDYARTRANVDRAVHEIRTSAAALAVEHIRIGDLAGARMVMDDCLIQQCRLAKVRHLELVPCGACVMSGNAVEKDVPTCRVCHIKSLSKYERTRAWDEPVTGCIYLCPEHQAAEAAMLAAMPKVEFIKAEPINPGRTFPNVIPPDGERGEQS